jgi:hypothetical protein
MRATPAPSFTRLEGERGTHAAKGLIAADNFRWDWLQPHLQAGVSLTSIWDMLPDTTKSP